MSTLVNKRKIVPTKVVLHSRKRQFVADELPTPALALALEPAPTPMELPLQNSNPAEAIPTTVQAQKTFPKVDIIATYPNRVELVVPFSERDVVKAAGCKWWHEERIWIAPTFEGFEDIVSNYAGEYLCLRKEDHQEAKTLGAVFRPSSTTWFASTKECCEKFGCVYFQKAKFEDKQLLKTEGCRWSPIFRCWYTSRQNFLANPALSAFQ